MGWDGRSLPLWQGPSEPPRPPLNGLLTADIPPMKHILLEGPHSDLASKKGGPASCLNGLGGHAGAVLVAAQRA